MLVSCFAYSSTVNMKATSFSETSVGRQLEHIHHKQLTPLRNSCLMILTSLTLDTFEKACTSLRVGECSSWAALIGMDGWKQTRELDKVNNGGTVPAFACWRESSVRVRGADIPAEIRTQHLRITDSYSISAGLD
jgi:hypothetical protein